MEVARRPLQGVANIISFNRHFYFGGLILMVGLIVFPIFTGGFLEFYLLIAIAFAMLWSLAVSAYIYDFSGLYDFASIRTDGSEEFVINITAGFDETSGILKNRFGHAEFKVYNFYDPKKHTEISIERAVRSYPPFDRTINVKTSQLPLDDCTADKIFVIFAAHEIRERTERIAFFCELRRIIKDDGQIHIIEHLRDVPNFIAYNIGFLHFYPKKIWKKAIAQSGLKIKSTVAVNPFVTHFIIEKNGTTF